MPRVSHARRALRALQRAEALARRRGVSGPADEAPTRENLSEWIGDWKARASRALAEARRLAGSAVASVRDRGRQIATWVRESAHETLRYLDTMMGEVDAAIRDTVLGVARAAGEVTGAATTGLISTPGGLLLAAAVALYALSRL